MYLVVPRCFLISALVVALCTSLFLNSTDSLALGLRALSRRSGGGRGRKLRLLLDLRSRALEDREVVVLAALRRHDSGADVSTRQARARAPGRAWRARARPCVTVYVGVPSLLAEMYLVLP